MRKGLSTTDLRRELATRTTSHVLFMDSNDNGAKLGLQLGLSVEPGLKAVAGPDGRILDGYIVADQAEAKRIRDVATSNKVYCEQYGIPEVHGLAKRLLRGDAIADLNDRQKRIVGRVVTSFLDIATTGMGRATHYNTKEDQLRAERLAHATLFGMDRQTYSLLVCLSGLTDNARKIASWMLLEWPGVGEPSDHELQMEREVIRALATSITTPRMFQLFAMLRESGCNNSRTRRVILCSLLGSDKLPWWSVKYRRKLKLALQHAWGKRMASVIGSICRKRAWTQKERSILEEHVWAYVEDQKDDVQECIAFVLGATKGRWTTPLLRAFVAARDDLAAGRNLPPEVLEGIRSKYHPTKTHDDVLRLTAKTGAFTDGQKIKHQRRVEKAGTTVDFDPTHYDAVKLYIYAYERGMDARITAALDEKAAQAATSFPVSCEGAVVLVDASGSMLGDEKTQKLRPMAAALAISDMLVAGGAKRIIVGGNDRGRRLVRPAGDTSLALPLVQAVRDHGPSSVFVISDGYDNTPAGRFAEVVRALRKVGVSTPIYHLNPVAAAETASVRRLAPDLVPTLAVQDARALATIMLREALEHDPLAGLKVLLQRGRTAARAAISGKQPLAAATRERALGAGKNGKKVEKVLKDLTSTMKSALVDLYTRAPREGANVRYRGIAAPNTVTALQRRGLVQMSGNDYILHTDLGRQAAEQLRR